MSARYGRLPCPCTGSDAAARSPAAQMPSWGRLMWLVFMSPPVSRAVAIFTEQLLGEMNILQATVHLLSSRTRSGIHLTPDATSRQHGLRVKPAMTPFEPPQTFARSHHDRSLCLRRHSHAAR